MKTNQIMIRKMGAFDVAQRTKDGFFNATFLLKQWNEATNSKKNTNHYLDLVSTKEFFKAIIDDDSTIRDSERPMNQVVNISKAKTLKNGKRVAGEVWLSPIAFIDFAMWLNPSFRVKVIKYVYDQMINYRNEAGDAYKELAKAIGTIVDKSFMPTAMKRVAKGLNYIIFGEHETLIRNQYGDEEKMRELFRFELKVADLINEGFLKDMNDVMSYLRRMWSKKHTPELFIK